MRHKYVFDSLRRFVNSGLSVLDVGCGSGFTSRFMAELGAKVVAFDYAKERIKFAIGWYAHKNVDYLVADVRDLALKKKFDVITIVDSMEHIEKSDIWEFFDVLSKHSHESTIIYLNIPEHRHQKKMRALAQPIDEQWSLIEILGWFEGVDYYPIHLALMGDVKAEYVELIFSRSASFH
jgi:2-polyprenyl-3-methyl-5-hydroxy-6-metoxy-1,4-benzoquinol methylase